jgi:hypothetical protein
MFDLLLSVLINPYAIVRRAAGVRDSYLCVGENTYSPQPGGSLANSDFSNPSSSSA